MIYYLYQRKEEKARRKEMKKMKKQLENRMNGVEDQLDDDEDDDEDEDDYDYTPIPYESRIQEPREEDDVIMQITEGILYRAPAAVGTALLDVVGLAGESVKVVAAGAKDVSSFGIGVVASGFGLLTLASWITTPTLDQEEESILLRDNAPVAMQKLLVSRLAASLVESLRLAPHFTAIITVWIDEALQIWKKVAGTNNLEGVPKIKVPDDSSDQSDKISKFAIEVYKRDKLNESDFQKRFNRVQKDEAEEQRKIKLSLREKIGDNKDLTDKEFIAWYVICRLTGTKFSIPADNGFPVFTEEHTSLMAAVLKRNNELYDISKNRGQTMLGYTFDEAIQCGIDVPYLLIGCSAGDSESYSLFKEFYAAIVSEIGIYNHIRMKYLNEISKEKESDQAWFNVKKNVENFEFVGHNGRFDIDPSHVTWADDEIKEFIHFSFIGCHRNIRGLPFPIFSNRAERRQSEEILKNAIDSHFTGNLKGIYTSIYQMSDTEREFFEQNRIIFSKPNDDSMLFAAGGAHDWPHNRGLFHDDAKSFILWVNNEDHLQIDVKILNSGLLPLYQRYLEIIDGIHDGIKARGIHFARDDDFGYHTVCPSNCGSGFRAGALLLVPNLCIPKFNIQEICARLGLECRKMKHGGVEIAEVYTKYRFGFSETETMQALSDGIRSLVKMEIAIRSNDNKKFLDIVQCLPKDPDEYVGPILNLGPPSLEKGSALILEKRLFVEDQRYLRKDDYPVFTSAHTSYVAKYLTTEVFDKIENRADGKGLFLSHAIRTAVDVPNSKIGIYLSGKPSYEAFYDLLNPIIKNLHDYDFLKAPHITNLDLWKVTGANAIEVGYVKSCSITTSRNIDGIFMSPIISRKMRRAVEHIVRTSIDYMDASSTKKGKFYSRDEIDMILNTLERMDVSVDAPPYSSESSIAGCARDWHDARGIFLNGNKNMAITVNEEDHIKMIVKEESSSVNMRTVVKTFALSLKALEDSLLLCGYTFLKDNRLGFLTCSPANLGTALYVNLVIELPTVGNDPLMAIPIAETFYINAEKINNKTWRLRNMYTMGRSEVEILQDMINCVLSLIRMDKAKSLQDSQMSFKNKIAFISIDDRNPDPPIVHNTDKMDDILRQYKEIYKPAVRVIITKRDMPPIPDYIITKFKTATGSLSLSPFQGRWVKAKLSSCPSIEDNDFKRQYAWIDPITQTIHWGSNEDKKIDHKCISIISAKSVEVLTEATTGFVFTLITGEVLQIQLPKDWPSSEQADWANVVGFIRGEQNRI